MLTGTFDSLLAAAEALAQFAGSFIAVVKPCSRRRFVITLSRESATFLRMGMTL